MGKARPGPEDVDEEITTEGAVEPCKPVDHTIPKTAEMGVFEEVVPPREALT